MNTDFAINRLASGDVDRFRALIAVFGEAFDEPDMYGGAPAADDYLVNLLSDDTFVALTALREKKVVGGLVAYEFRKFERQCSEFYIYDLAVAAAHRRRGVATALIDALKPIAAARNAAIMMIQADHGDAPAVALYSKLGTPERVLHFDIPVY